MKYAKNNLNEVIFHLKFSPLSKLYTNKKDAVSEFQKYVEKEFPEISFEKKKKIKYNVDSSGKFEEYQSDEEYLTWTFSNDEKEIRLNAKEAILIQNGEIYRGFEDYMKDVNLIIKGLEKYDLKSVKSIGLRYINQIKISDETEIEKYFNPDLHLNAEEFKKEEFVESITKTDLLIEEYDFIFKYGRFNPDYPSRSSKKDVILDYDCILDYDEELEYVSVNLGKMHKIILDRFENDIKDKLRDEMR